MNSTPATPHPLADPVRQRPGDVATLTPEALLTPEQAAQVLGLSVKTLATWRSTGRYTLPFIRCGSRIRYQRADLDAWLADRQRTSKVAREVAA
ncbi:helix-turn-helix domain-containing protein [Pseudomonas jinjuensis]|uniref:DNA binding domain-containing protein, excisionase family n=2 Tax=Pseudomonas jinjuensis TaxID=198616 RepID=A0A1H0BM46_9PSED|nr:helix-turn-helix domain-containing protein [Pseudomonas jinjuensis]SDN46694.1 DNA binding domain-containing protein, excisionase family [Pseudomonas jinjuensis]